MEALSEQHVELKKSISENYVQGPRGAGMAGTGAAVHRLQELRKRARVLATFAGLIPKGCCDIEIKSKIQNLEAQMI